MAKVVCKKCGKEHPIEKQMFGRKVVCSQCGYRFRIGVKKPCKRPRAEQPDTEPFDPTQAAHLSDPELSGASAGAGVAVAVETSAVSVSEKLSARTRVLATEQSSRPFTNQQVLWMAGAILAVIVCLIGLGLFLYWMNT